MIHNSSPEWIEIKEAAEKAREVAGSEGDELGEMTCSELLEALELSRCLFLMRCKKILTYIQGGVILFTYALDIWLACSHCC